MISVGVAVPACALFTDLGALSNGERETGADTGSSTTTDGPGVKVGPTTGDGGSDVSCGHLFCEDFDDDAGWSRWESMIKAPGAPSPTMGIDSKAASTPPSSLLVTGQALRWADQTYLRKVFDVGETASLQCSFDIRVEALPPDGEYVVGAFAAAGSGPALEAALVLRGTAARLDLVVEDVPDGGGSGSVDGPLLGVEQWRNIVVTLKRGQTPTLSLSDGVSVHTMPVPSWPATPKLAFGLGLVFANPYLLEDAHLQARYDTIRCDAL